MRFTKMHGAGNDYIYVNGFEETVRNRGAVAKYVSDRHFGVGSDGLVIIEPSSIADFKMDMYNSDGSQGRMCGNATRCVAKYVCDHGLTDRDEISLETRSGVKYIRVTKENGRVKTARVNMGEPVLEPAKIPADFDGERAVGRTLRIDEKTYTVTCVSMGNPHCVTVVDDVDKLKLEELGPRFEHCERFPDRVNTEFVEKIDAKTLRMRVWERGAGETLACGTGACATAVAMILSGDCSKDEEITIELRGGTLSVLWDSATNDVYMTGPAAEVFQGEIDISHLQ